MEMLEGGWPWLLLWPVAVRWAWNERGSRWGRWCLGTQAILTLAILPLKTQLPWYNHPLWLPFSLLCAVPLAWLVRRDRARSAKGAMLLAQIPGLWVILGFALVLFGLVGALDLLVPINAYSSIALALGFGWGIGGWLLQSPKYFKRMLGLLSLLIGSWVGLAFLMGSPLWLWELNEHWSVSPVAELASRANVSAVAIDSGFERPSLNWYAQKQIKSFDDKHRNKCIAIKKTNVWDLYACND